MKAMHFLSAALVTFFMGSLAIAQDSPSEGKAEAKELAVPVNPDQEKEAAVPAAKESSTSSENRGVEKIEVTGSHIKRIDIEGPSPVLSLDREYLERSGYNSVGDVLRDSTVTAVGVEREDSGSGQSGSAVSGLRGFGPDKILVLLNGTRLPKIGGQNAVDLNLIPFAAIDRVDILKDGASAIYGSDALAGVINFITKKDFDGATVNLRYSAADKPGGDRQDVSAMYGKNSSKGNFLAIYQYRNNTEIKDNDRDWSSPGLSIFGSPGSYRTVSGPATSPTVGPWQESPDCPPGKVLDTGPNGKFCSFDYTPYSWMQPAIEQHSGILSGNYEVSDLVDLYGTATYTTRQSRWQYAPAPDFFADDTDVGGGNFQIPNAVNALPGWGLPGIGGSDFEIGYRLVDELGPRGNRDTTDSYGATLGARGYLSDTWEWDFSMNHGASSVYNRGHSGYGNKTAMFDLLTDGTWTPFGATKGDLSGGRHVAEAWIDSSLTMAQFKASGELGMIGSGLLTAAFGASGAWEDYQERVDQVTRDGALFGGAGTEGKASRNYQALFSELSYALGQFEFQLAARFDHFNDFGETVNPKFALRYKPTESLMFRGSVGTGFKAPTLQELYGASGYGFPTFTDITACDTIGGDYYCGQQQYKTLQGGNSTLREETSFSYNIGAILQPAKTFNMSVDYWYTAIDDAIGLELDDLMLAEKALGRAGIQSQGVDVIRDSSGAISEVIAPNLNLARQQADGLEFSFDYSMKLGGLTITPHVDHTHILSFLEEPFPGLGLISKLGESGRPRWKNTSYITFGFGQNTIRATARTIAGQFKVAHTADRSDQRRTANYTEYDLNYSYRGSWGGTISFGAKNIFDFDRPIDDTAGFANRLNASIYDQIGRITYLGYTHDF